MKKIILISLFGLMFSDSITYVKDYGILGKSVSPEVIEGIKILEVNEYTVKYQNESGSVETLSLDFVIDIEYDDGSKFEISDLDKNSIDSTLKNSGYYLSKSGKSFTNSLLFSGIGYLFLYSKYPEISAVSFICSFFYQISAYSNLEKSGEILQNEIKELQQDNNE